MNPPSVLNVAGYKFVPLDRLPERCADLRLRCADLDLKGTILLSPEGINLFLAGTADRIGQLLQHLRGDECLRDLEVKKSYSDTQPFRRMLVKIKSEAIAFGVDGIEPAERSTAKLAATDLRRWLREGRDLVLLDVRNDYEVRLGTFQGAQPVGVDHFRDFPAAVEKLPEEIKDKTLVMFCTGGIRCEKAGPYMETQGFRRVYQLDGGILKYFEECGGDFYDGECFVFDHRVALDSKLAETDTRQCFRCQAPLTAAEQQSPHYVLDVCCPHCYCSRERVREESIAARREAIRRAVSPLPGSRPYGNARPLNVPGRYAGCRLIDFLCDYHGHVPRDEWQRAIDAAQIVHNGWPLSADAIVGEGQRLERLFPATVEPDVRGDILLLDEDEALVVVAKPSPLPMHPCGRYNRNSLAYIMQLVYDDVLRPAHRLDANTSGLVVFSRSRKHANVVQRQFEEGTVEKRYLARVPRHCPLTTFECDAPISTAPGEAGCRTIDAAGQPARTRFEVLRHDEHAELGPTTLLSVVPLSGRTNQIRAHLWHLGMPIVGDPTYLPGGELARRQTLLPSDPPMMLHAHHLKLAHPVSGSSVSWEAPLPKWAE